MLSLYSLIFLIVIKISHAPKHMKSFSPTPRICKCLIYNLHETNKNAINL